MARAKPWSEYAPVESSRLPAFCVVLCCFIFLLGPTCSVGLGVLNRFAGGGGGIGDDVSVDAARDSLVYTMVAPSALYMSRS